VVGAGRERAGGRGRARALAGRRDRAPAGRLLPDVGGYIPIPYNFDILVGESVVGRMDRKFKLRDQYVLDLGGDAEKRLDRRLAIALAIGLDTLQNR
jgi:hypothetical protein